MQRLALIVTALAITACDGGPESLQMRLAYAQGSCGDTPVNNAFFEGAGTVGVHVLDSTRDNVVVIGTCLDLPQQAFRALNDLPRILDEELALEPLPLSGIVRFQVDVFDTTVACAPYRAGDDPIPKYSGISVEVFLQEDPSSVDVQLHCL